MPGETRYLITCLVILLFTSVGCATIVTFGGVGGTYNNLGLPNYGYMSQYNNYTISQDFRSVSSLPQIAENDVWGTWAINQTYGLYPTSLVNRDWVLGSNYMARCTFGSVRYLNNSWTEEYYLNNINRNSNDFTGILMRYGTYQSSLYFPGSYELYLCIKGNQVYLQEVNYAFGLIIPGGNPINMGYTLPAGVTSGNISYTATLDNGNINPVNNEINGEYDYTV